MRSDAQANKAVLALARAIEATFEKGDWVALGLATDSDAVIRNHRRLLRSLDWRDRDYAGNILEVLPAVLGGHTPGPPGALAAERFPRLAEVEEHVGLERWLAENDAALHRELYAATDAVVLDELEDTAHRLSIPDIEQHAARIRRGLRDDPAQAIGSSKELLETTLKAVLGLHGTGPETKLEIPQLVKRANIMLGLDAATVDASEPGAEPRRKVLGSLAQIVTGAAELRNAGLGTGHGVSQGPVLDVATARMVVSAAVAAATFYREAAAALDPAASSTADEIPW